MDTTVTTWSERVTALRQSGMTLAGIARHIGISPQGACDIEQGRTREPMGMAAVRLYMLHRRRVRR